MPLRTKIEFSRRGMHEEVAFDAVDSALIRDYELSPLMLSHYTPETALAQKIGALAGRRQPQARDVFDLHLLLASGISLASEPPLKKTAVDRACENAWSVTFDMFKAQVLAFLHPDHAAQYDARATWESMVLKVVQELGGGS